ncbi:MAG: exosortase/archaeosortase family protein [Terriglobales bacterium]
MTSLPAPLRFALLCGLSLLVEWRPLAATFSLAVSREEYTHILLIIPICAALMFLDRQVFKFAATSGSLWGVAFCLLAASIAALAKWASGVQPDEQLALAMLALVVWVAGAFILCFGFSAARAFLFPLGFLLWLVPFPDFVLARVVAFLQQWSAFSAQALFSAVGIPVSQDGFFLTIPGLTLEVAKECSSIRSSLMLVVTTMVLAQLELRSFWRKLLIVALAVPLSVAKNGFRIFVIGMLGTKVDPAYLTGRLHHHGGVVFLLIALGIVFLLLWVLRKGEQRPMSLSSAQH